MYVGTMAFSNGFALASDKLCHPTSRAHLFLLYDDLVTACDNELVLKWFSDSRECDYFLRTTSWGSTLAFLRV